MIILSTNYEIFNINELALGIIMTSSLFESIDLIKALVSLKIYQVKDILEDSKKFRQKIKIKKIC